MKSLKELFPPLLFAGGDKGGVACDKSTATCPLCGGRIAPGSTTVTVDLKSGLLIVRDVPAEVCRMCGEEWFIEDVSRTLEELTAETRAKGAQMEVLSYPKRKAAAAS